MVGHGSVIIVYISDVGSRDMLMFVPDQKHISAGSCHVPDDRFPLKVKRVDLLVLYILTSPFSNRMHLNHRLYGKTEHEIVLFFTVTITEACDKLILNTSFKQ